VVKEDRDRAEKPLSRPRPTASCPHILADRACIRIWMRRFISTAYSSGSSLTIGSTKPATTMPRPRIWRVRKTSDRRAVRHRSSRPSLRGRCQLDSRRSGDVDDLPPASLVLPLAGERDREHLAVCALSDEPDRRLLHRQLRSRGCRRPLHRRALAGDGSLGDEVESQDHVLPTRSRSFRAEREVTLRVELCLPQSLISRALVARRCRLGLGRRPGTQGQSNHRTPFRTITGGRRAWRALSGAAGLARAISSWRQSVGSGRGRRAALARSAAARALSRRDRDKSSARLAFSPSSRSCRPSECITSLRAAITSAVL
jgi:hypothetical protein